MGRYITTIGLRPEAIPAYTRIKETNVNFSEFISDMLIAYDDGETATLLRIDALRRQINTLKTQLKDLYSNNGVVRKELSKEKYQFLQSVARGDL